MRIRKYIKRGAALVCFIVLLVMTMRTLNQVLTIKKNNTWTINGLSRQKPDTVDVLIVGTSHSYRSFLPMKLWNDCGYSAYNISTSNQSLLCSYYLIRDAIKRQHPKVIVLEMYAVTFTDKYGPQPELAAHAAFDQMPLSPGKIEAWWSHLRKDFGMEESLSFLMPFTLYHDRWKKVRKPELTNKREYTKGGIAAARLKPQTPPVPTDLVTEPEGEAEKYFRKIVSLCSSEGIRLVLPSAPVAQDPRTQEILQRMNGGLKLAEELRVDAYSMDETAKAAGIDYSTDFYNFDHLNGSGAIKMTDWLEGYLEENTDLTDHRGNPRYDSWNQYSGMYAQHLEKVRKKLQMIADEYAAAAEQAATKTAPAEQTEADTAVTEAAA